MTVEKITHKKMLTSDFLALTEYSKNTIYLVTDSVDSGTLEIYISSNDDKPTVKRLDISLEASILPIISMVSLTAIGANSIQATANISSLGDYTVGTMYRFVYGTDINTNICTQWFSASGTGIVSYVINNLLPSTIYYVGIEIADAYRSTVRSVNTLNTRTNKRIYNNGIYYGGTTDNIVNTATILNSSGSIVGNEVSVGSARGDIAGASV
jgi:hypothetical protein